MALSQDDLFKATLNMISVSGDNANSVSVGTILRLFKIVVEAYERGGDDVPKWGDTVKTL